MENYTDFMLNSGVISALIVGVFLVLFTFVVKTLRKDEDTRTVTKAQKESVVEKRREQHSQVQKTSSRKRNNENRWTGNRKPQQHFSHPWHLTTFKGHTGNVLDLDFSSNGKFLATCSDEDPGSISTEDSVSENSISSSSDSNKGNASSSTLDDVSPRKGLSRRQKKNRRSVDSSPPEQKSKSDNNQSKPKQRTAEKKTTTVKNNHRRQIMPTLKEFEKLQLKESDFYALLHEHVILPEQMFTLGFPDEVDNKVRIFKQQFWKGKKKITLGKASSLSSTSSSSSSYTDSDQTSTSSSDGLEEVETSKEEEASRVYESPRLVLPKPKEARSRSCSRCNTQFFTTAEEYLTQARCNYHWGKLRYTAQTDYNVGIYSCCERMAGSAGCSVARYHVWNGLDAGINDSLNGFVKTKPGRMKNDSYGIYALDCEMCFTVKGLELCKVTVVGIDGRLVYNHFVRPEREVIDYNTRFSGVDERDLRGENVKTLREVQRDLLSFINDKTILIGHALENDLRALKLVHKRIVDTSLSFPHDRGYPYKYSLKHLAAQILQKEIQTSELGHDSYEDASSCMELMKWRIQFTLNMMRLENNNNGAQQQGRMNGGVQQHAIRHHQFYNHNNMSSHQVPRMPRTFRQFP